MTKKQPFFNGLYDFVALKLSKSRANIIRYEVNNSRFVVDLHNVDLVDKEGIQKMGAKGIVEIDNELKIIFGDDAKQLKKNIDDLK